MKEKQQVQPEALSPRRERELTQRLNDHLSKRLRDMRRSYKRSVRKSDPDAVHDLRVATRRVGTVLDVVAFSAPAKAARKTRKKLKRLRHVLSARRDLDVLLNTMQARAKQAASMRRKQLWNIAIHEIRIEGEAARRQSRRWLKHFNLADLERQIRNIVRQRLKDGFSWSDLRAAARRADQKLRQAVKEARAASDSSRFHEVRIKTKTFRYMVELDSLLVGIDRSGSLIERLKNIQDELGEWRDQAELCRRLTAVLSTDAGLQADHIATAIIDAARNRTRLQDQDARRTINSLRNFNGSQEIAALSDGREPTR